MQTDDIDALRRQFEKLRPLGDFRPEGRIWWLYLRSAVEEVLERHDLPGLSAAHNGVKDFPENLPDEATRWHALRDAVAEVLGRIW